LTELTVSKRVGENGRRFRAATLNEEDAMTQSTSSEPGDSPPADEELDTAEELEGGELGDEDLEDVEPRPRRRWHAQTILPWALVATLALIGLALLWTASEDHYRGCVEAVGVRTAGDNSPLGRFARQDVTKCTRSPF
jgi:hypothetical protein